MTIYENKKEKIFESENFVEHIVPNKIHYCINKEPDKDIFHAKIFEIADNCWSGIQVVYGEVHE